MDGGEEGVDRVEAVLGEVAAQAGGTVRRGAQPGREVRRVVLVDQPVVAAEFSNWHS